MFGYAHETQEGDDAASSSTAYTCLEQPRQLRAAARLAHRTPERSAHPRTDRHRICPCSESEAGFLAGVSTPLGAGTPLASRIAANDGGNQSTVGFSRAWGRPTHTLEGSQDPYALLRHRTSRRKGAGPLSQLADSVTDHRR